MSARRRGGKPNRGGGKFNKPRGAGGGGGGRKAGSAHLDDDYDDFTLDVGLNSSSRLSNTRGGSNRPTGARNGSIPSRGCRAGACYNRTESVLPKSLARNRTYAKNFQPDTKASAARKPDASSVPMQRILMTDKNQELLKELLWELRTRDFDEQDDDAAFDGLQEEEKEELDELDFREEGQFWNTNDEPVERAESPKEYESDNERRPAEPVVSLFAISKLCRYGFDRERSKQALESNGGEFGSTLEQLLQQVYTERYGQDSISGGGLAALPEDECLNQRQEEALALAAIYGDRFQERITNSVWVVTLDALFLTDNIGKNYSVTSKNVCQFYLKSKGCRYGDKCKFKHQAAQAAISALSPLEYELEIRFPKGNRYPSQAPVVAFSTNDESVKAAGRLTVTEKLFEEALTAASDNQPVVYTLVSLCEDENIMKELLAVAHHKYSNPPPVLGPAPAKKKIPTNHFSEESVCPSRRIAPISDRTREEDDNEVSAISVENVSSVNLRKRVTDNSNVLKENGKLCRDFDKKQSSKRFKSMLEQRTKLPAWNERDNILDVLNNCQVLVISGMTGCGKTTQIPQFVLDATLSGPADKVANIVCTQPRRISAMSVAERVAQERAESLGNSVGYQIRLKSVRSSATRLLYCTTGVLLRRLEADVDLQGVTHVIVDEVHERTEESDFLLLVLKDLILQRPDLKVILMSATLNANLFSEYFYDCPTIHIPGRTFPVTQFFLEDVISLTRYVIEDGSPYIRSSRPNSLSGQARVGPPKDVVDTLGDDMWNFMSFTKKDFVKDSVPDQQLSLQELTVRFKDCKASVLKTMAAMDLDKINIDLIENLLEWIVDGNHSYPPGAVLVFLPGIAEIKMLYEQLQSNRRFNNRRGDRCVVYPLHSTLSNEEQQAVFNRPPEGVTKIIISTNIAETSVTIDDVVFVIDSGKLKEKRYDASKSMESLEDTWVSRANALQRKGRAGRVASGVCFHLFTSHCFQHQLAQQQLPEIQRVPLEQLCLRIKILDVFAEQTLESVFRRLIEPPVAGSLDAAKQRLRDLGALTAEEKLTPLGYHLARLPVDVRVAKLMLFGAIFRCLDPALTIAASLAFKSPFVAPWDKREQANEKKLEFALANSDHLALLQAYKGWCSAEKAGHKSGSFFCRENFLSLRVLQEIACVKRQFAELLSDIGFIKEGLTSRAIERLGSKGSDGVFEATGPEANLNSDNIKLMSAMLCAALYPNVVQVLAPQGVYKMSVKGAVKMLPKTSELRFLTKSDGCVQVHPSSVNYNVRKYPSPYLVYLEKVKTSRVFIRDCSTVSVYALVLFGGGAINVEMHKGQFVISLDDGWIRFAADSHQVAELVKELRWELDRLLEDKIRNPSIDLCTCPRGSRIIRMIVNLVSTQ
ncbi:putative ATP-dependent RNA helicase DHX57 [Corythoichthys intestinalis]|uniref:putative ATP-dependent RNA helicase DHX57 n=1 Tax=Corythoichthys intestinalis TaxID=161448 RepID=UPI0025A65718|nr:putative ATP-dependent RNA helicase DHX57 [Corythoichthys intestinalis]XP_061809328.1 putative ATP-dependent RNA helicase DHX57 [Nerophis lumbriciformis]